MSKSAVFLALVEFVCILVFVATEECNTVAQPDVIDVSKRGARPDFVVILGYTADNVTVRYKCPHGDSGGDLGIYAIAKSESSTDQKMLSYYPVPGMQDNIRLSQHVNNFKFELRMKLDPDGFTFTGLCYTKSGGESKQWRADTKTPENFPFILTDAGQLRFDMKVCTNTQPALTNGTQI